ncbi:cytidine deaminase [Aggregatilinea lenta]|uniref:cytidine deaminase n=1 Tax=Aggregatilinea lenta TaxID=913108 RepID=UPI001EE7AFCC|nr:cytidine deaminase [Aggregatilinea lenta]
MTSSLSPLTDEQRRSLIDAAASARKNAYAPYSNFTVGAAILGDSGTVYSGCNVESASYGATICGERTAAVKAISEGERRFRAVAIVTGNAAMPCGICRQFLYEFGPEMWVITADPQGRSSFEGPLKDLLPYGFGPADLVEVEHGEAAD